MSKYNVAWNQESRTLTIQDTDTEAGEGSNVVSHIVYGALGDIPDAASHPEPGQHLRNVAKQQGFDNYDLITVVNETDNDRLERFVKEADEKAVELYLRDEANKVLEKPTGSLERKAIENADKADPLADEVEEQIEQDETDAQRGARERRADDSNKVGGEDGTADTKNDAKTELSQDSKDTVEATAGGVKSTAEPVKATDTAKASTTAKAAATK